MHSYLILINLLALIKFDILHKYDLFFITYCNGVANGVDNSDWFLCTFNTFGSVGVKLYVLILWASCSDCFVLKKINLYYKIIGELRVVVYVVLNWESTCSHVALAHYFT
jgi:hypothetical protein